MILLPIQKDNSLNQQFASDPKCAEILAVYPAYYERIGFSLPWVGYFASVENKFVGCGGYKGGPKNGKIEIAYNTFSEQEGKGFGTEICHQLVIKALETDPEIIVSARTLPEENGSTTILKRNGFELIGTIWDDEDGDVWEWIYKS